MKKIWFLKVLKIIKNKEIMKKYNALKLTMFFLGISLTLAFHYVGPSNVMAYGTPYDGFVINLDGSIVAPGGGGYPPLYSTNGYQWSYSPSYDYGYPLSYYNSYDGFGYGYPPSYFGSYGGFGYGYQQAYDPYGYQQSYNPYGNQQSYNPYGYQQQPYNYGWGQPSYGWDAYNYMYPSNYNPYSHNYQNVSPYNSYMPYGYTPPYYNYTPDSNYQWKWSPTQGWNYDLALQWGGYPRGITSVPGGWFIPGQGFTQGIAY